MIRSHNEFVTSGARFVDSDIPDWRMGFHDVCPSRGNSEGLSQDRAIVLSRFIDIVLNLFSATMPLRTPGTKPKEQPDG